MEWMLLIVNGVVVWVLHIPSINDNTNNTVQMFVWRSIESVLQKGYDFIYVPLTREFEVVYESLCFDITAVL
jgi:uncharacterized protein YfbU (UPF0304 family)